MEKLRTAIGQVYGPTVQINFRTTQEIKKIAEDAAGKESRSLTNYLCQLIIRDMVDKANEQEYADPMTKK